MVAQIQVVAQFPRYGFGERHQSLLVEFGGLTSILSILILQKFFQSFSVGFQTKSGFLG